MFFPKISKCLVVCLFTLSPALLAKDAPTATTEKNPTPVTETKKITDKQSVPLLDAYAILQPLKSSIPPFLEFASQIHVPQQKLLPLTLMLAFFGYPDFQGLSDSHNIGLFLLHSKSNNEYPPIIALIKLSDENYPFKVTLKTFGWDLKEYQGWIFMAPKGETFDLIEDLDPLIKLTQETTSSTLTLTVIPHKSSIPTILQFLKDNFSSMNMSHWNHYESISTDISSHLQSLTHKINFSKQELSLEFQTKANDNTPEAQLLAQSIKNPRSLATFIPSGSIFSATGCFDPTVTKHYINDLYARFAKKAHFTTKPNEEKKWINEYLLFLNKTLDLSNGNFLTTVNFNAPSSLSQLKAYSGNFSNDYLIRFIKQTKNIASQKDLLFPYLRASSIPPSYSWKENQAHFQGIPIHQFSTEEFLQTPNPESSNSNDYKIDSTQKDLFLAEVDGNLITSDNPNTLEKLIATSKTKDTTLHNLQSLFPFKKNTVFQFQFHPKPYFIYKLAQEKHPYEDTLKAILVSPFGPINGSISLNNGTLTASTSISTDNLSKLLCLLGYFSQ